MKFCDSEQWRLASPKLQLYASYCRTQEDCEKYETLVDEPKMTDGKEYPSFVIFAEWAQRTRPDRRRRSQGYDFGIAIRLWVKVDVSARDSVAGGRRDVIDLPRFLRKRGGGKPL